ncbi:MULTISPECIES: DUF397 domain-containing protein [Streptomyces]|uniref:DUF397 domain-containing protein n=1 Tax=Streptomyces evansiae TaxID=3075535 RepID=A0ABU2QX90_9ACTN|nr:MULTISPECIES: DUF397 domain-containing protein [unclassified Streptomyces]MDT0407625.1 DUF397 domain-containing protein [Streptomyces sp. DSM 41979]MYQ61125.1 DUF397 domain-containing protein [Streptomyces sp. SID4926]SCD56381.1 protein of unknown function [Streptomyces sp. DfronAA-171]
MTNGHGLTWMKSSYSGADGGNCVELAVGERTMPVRDSKRADSGPVIEFGRAAFGRFLGSVREG